MRYNDALRSRRWRPALAAIVTLFVVAVGAQVGWAAASAEHPHGPHTLVSGDHGSFAVAADHPHVESGADVGDREPSVEAALPRTLSTLVALGLAAVAAIGLRSDGTGESSVPRGPPRPRIDVQSGARLLLRLCVTRR